MSKSEYIHKSHNVSVLIYHIILPAKYRRVVFSQEVDETLKAICLEITKRYPIYFLEIGTDKTHVHFLLHSVPRYSPTQICNNIEKYNSQRDIQKASRSKEAIVGMRILE